MSKKQSKQKQKKSFPWVLLAFGGVLIITAIIILFANRGGGDGGGTPSIAVDQQKIDYGDVKFGVNKTFAIKVTNTGDGTLRFKEEPYIEVLEGC
ncbi:MAG: hypothetical protein HYX49_09515 [Chloroflexi bacterium]|nr:hypothetical protein [Chloroflexota bacterium]